ncbi:MAG: MMPL family transporter [Planctomycetes bacterium]|nr:MMPL family transporter [Planctomycetota bacterium]
MSQDLPAEVQAVSQKWFSVILQTSLARDFGRFLTGALLVVLLVLGVALRCWRRVLICVLPAVSGLVVMLAVMGCVGLRLNMFNMAASVLVLGLSIDYGIFMVQRRDDTTASTEQAVAASALTTLTGFGALSLAQHPAMFSLGITVVLGIVPAMFCALIVLPALQQWQGKN